MLSANCTSFFCKLHSVIFSNESFNGHGNLSPSTTSQRRHHSRTLSFSLARATAIFALLLFNSVVLQTLRLCATRGDALPTQASKLFLQNAVTAGACWVCNSFPHFPTHSETFKCACCAAFKRAARFSRARILGTAAHGVRRVRSFMQPAQKPWPFCNTTVCLFAALIGHAW